MRALVIANPAATTTSVATLEVTTRALRSCLKVDVVSTTARGHAYELAREARRDRLDVVIALGGDGTVNETVNGLLADGLPQWESHNNLPPPPNGSIGDWEVQQEFPLLGVVPGGSTNVFSRAIGLTGNPMEATNRLIHAVTNRHTREIGLGRANGRYFTFNAGVGFDAEILAEVERQRARGKKACATLVIQAGVKCFFTTTDRRSGPLSYTCSQGASGTDVHTLFVANTTPYTYVRSRPLTVAPQASFDFGLDVVAFDPLTVKDSLVSLAKMSRSAAQPLNGNSVRTWHDLPDLRVQAHTPVQWQLDGEPLGEVSQLEFASVPHALRVLV